MRLVLSFALSVLLHIPAIAQKAKYNPSKDFSELKKSFIQAGHDGKPSKQMKVLAAQLDEFLSHVKIELDDNACHNMIPRFNCYFDDMPLSTTAYLRSSIQTDTIAFQDGKWYADTDIANDAKFDILMPGLDLNNRAAEKLLREIEKKHSWVNANRRVAKPDTALYVKEENLYYAAISSKKIPPFEIMSNNAVINYASCLKTIFKASRIEATYDEIIGKYLGMTIDDSYVPSKNCSKEIAGRKVVTTFFPAASFTASTLVDELLQERFVIAIDKDGNVGLITAIAMTKEGDYHPIHVRMRLPLLVKDKTVQMSWIEFCSRISSIIKTDVY